jgi:pyruvate/2-oxoglutarate dehydrogenase complex dihydrolipoamide acyltransferase (E2) component
MKQKHVDYQVVPNPKMRRWFAAAFRPAQHTPVMHGLLEVDVTRARAFLREQKAKTGESLSFTAFLIACLAQAVDEHKAVQAIRLGSKHLILFDDAVGMFGNGAGWGIPPALPTLMMTVGGIGAKPVLVDGHLALRDSLSLTLSFDHDIIDGALAARFIERLKELIESGYGLDDSTVELEQAGAEAAAKKS